MNRHGILTDDSTFCLTCRLPFSKNRWLPAKRRRFFICAIPIQAQVVKISSLTGRFPSVSYALGPAFAELARFGLREEIVQDCDIVECRL